MHKNVLGALLGWECDGKRAGQPLGSKTESKLSEVDKAGANSQRTVESDVDC